MKVSSFVSAACAGLSLLAASALAHHSFAMFDHDRVWTWEGTVVEFQWRQPHSHIIIDVPEDGKDPRIAGRWDFESSSPNIAKRQGWHRNVVKPGEPITIVGNPLLDGSKGGSLKYAITADGTVLYHDVNRTVTPENTPATNEH